MNNNTESKIADVIVALAFLVAYASVLYCFYTDNTMGLIGWSIVCFPLSMAFYRVLNDVK